MPTAIIGNGSSKRSIQDLERKLLDRNSKAMVLLAIILVNPTCRIIIHNSKMNNFDWPFGLTCDEVKVLKKLQARRWYIRS